MEPKKYNYSQKVWIAGGIIAILIILLLFIRAIFNVLLLVLVASLISVYFRGISDYLRKKTHWKSSLTLPVSIVGTVLIVGFLFWLIGARVQAQLEDLIEDLPALVENAEKQIIKSAVGRNALEYVSSSGGQEGIKSTASVFLKSTFGFFGDLYIILIAGIYLTVDPDLYKRGVISLVPKKGKKKTAEVLDKIGIGLKQWLKGQFISMAIIFSLIGISLRIIGFPMWLTLAIITGILNFIPNFGPFMTLILAALIGLTIDLQTTLVVAIIYLVAQGLEGMVITPLIQQRMIDIPPVLLIVSQVIIATLTGFWGLVVAAPLMVIVMILVQELYIKKEY